jgi:hypothetical protein
MKAHVEESHPGTSYSCQSCDFKSNTQNDLREHIILTHTAKNVYLCDKCGYSTYNSVHLKRHQEVKHGSFLCDKCDFQSSDYGALANHKRGAHKVVCPKCSYVLNAGITLDEHECPMTMGPGAPDKNLVDQSNKVPGHKMIRRLKQGTYLCIQCGFRTETKQIVSRHFHLCHGIKCHLCDYISVNNDSLMKHIKNSHTLKCQTCDQNFKTSEETNSHVCANIIPVTNDSNCSGHKCPECPYIASSKNYLWMHTKSQHLKQSVTSCEICKKEFKSKASYQLHYRRIHSKESKRTMYKCNECEHLTTSHSHLRRHCRRSGHTYEGKQHKCVYEGCGFKTYELSQLQSHRRQIHEKII